MKIKIIAVDFDGTLCENKWPEIGAPNEDVINYLKEQKQKGVKLILWTCRAGDKLDKAVEWCKELGLEFDAVNENVPAVIAMFGADTRKIYADEYIDDKMCKRFSLPYSKKKRTIDNAIKIGHITAEEIKSIEDFVTRTEEIIEFRELQTIVKIQYEVYRHLILPTYVCKTNE